MLQTLRRFVLLLSIAGIAGCGPDYSPNTYAASAVQQANKVDKGVIVGVRQIDVSAAGVVGATTGAAAGAAVGSNAPGGGLGSAFGAIGGGLLGGIVGSATEHTVGDTSGYEYIVRKLNGDLVSVTQKDSAPMAVGQHVLVIAGSQARIVPDYTVTPDAQPATAPNPPPVGATPLAPPAPPAALVPAPVGTSPPAATPPAATTPAAPPAAAPVEPLAL